MLSMHFPEEFRHKVDMENTSKGYISLFVDLKNVAEADRWILVYQQMSFTQWLSRDKKHNQKDIIYSAFYKCHHSAYRKSTTSAKRSKNMNCGANLKIVIRENTTNVQLRYQHVKEDNLPALIVINSNHSHDIESAEALSSLSPPHYLREQFEIYFYSNLRVANAMRAHSNYLRDEEGANEKMLANGFYNPKKRTICYWYELWMKTNIALRNGISMIQTLKELIVEEEKKGAIIKISEDPFALLIVTPLMKRTMNLPAAKDIIFVDSTALCDREENCVTFVFTTDTVRIKDEDDGIIIALVQICRMNFWQRPI
ncbi:uncharacterized protein LOC143923130 isoform X2 [Arctopsyche grandis]|uniref:uncharacterized protein LOC143923130 isoform X2 n=1 Tax=Arctopsyche grandis TaxID=121162 RepID=UPI00406D9793